jgi:hypothetical protein
MFISLLWPWSDESYFNNAGMAGFIADDLRLF